MVSFPRLLLLSVLLSIGCARGERAAPAATPLQDGDPLASEPWFPPVSHQRCAVLDPGVGSVVELADSARIAGAAADIPDGHALWSVAFDGNGQLADVRLLEHTLDANATDGLSGVVREAIRPQGSEGFVRLRFDAGSTPRLRVAGAQYCQAALVNVDAVRLAMAAVDRSGQVELELYIDQEGRVQERTVARSSGDETTDRMVLGLVAGMQYSPARLERLPIPSRLVYRVDLD